MSPHTPVPWTYAEHGGTFYVFGPGMTMVADGETDEGYLARIRGVGRGATIEEQRANAEFMVRACNAHDDLVTALQRFVDLADAEYLGTEARAVHAVKVARSAIAKAEGRQ